MILLYKLRITLELHLHRFFEMGLDIFDVSAYTCDYKALQRYKATRFERKLTLYQETIRKEGRLDIPRERRSTDYHFTKEGGHVFSQMP